MIIDFHNRGNGGGGGTADYATSAGTSNSTKLLEGESNFPQNANEGDVVAIGEQAHTKGAKSGTKSAAPALGIYQYDGSDWQQIGEGGQGGSSAYKIELSAVDPQYYTQQDIANINAFYAAFDADNSIADSAYIYAVAGIYRCVRYVETPQASSFTFEGTYNNNIVDIWLHFANNTYSYGGVQNAVPTPQTPDFTTLKSVSELPATGDTGDVIAVSIPPQEGTWVAFDGSAGATEVWMWTKSDGTYLLHFDNDNLYTGIDYTAGDPASFDGSGWGLTQDDTYKWHYDNNGYYISVWAEEEDGEWFIYAEMTQGEGGFSMIDAYQLAAETQMLVGGTEGSIGVYQYDGSAWNEIGTNGGSSSAYKIELSTNIPDDFTSEDIANLNAFFAAVEEDPSIADTSYVVINDDIYTCVYNDYDEEAAACEFDYTLTYTQSIQNISFQFADGEYSEGYRYENNFNTLYPNESFPADPVEGQIANYDDGQGNIGLYRYDGSDWQPYGGGSGGTYTLPIASSQTLGGVKVGSGLTIQADGTLSATGGGSGSSYISDLQPLDINILEGNGVGYVSDDDGQGNPTLYTTIEFDSTGGAFVNNYTDDGQGGWMQSDSYQLLRLEDVKNAQDDVMASGIIDGGDNVLRVDPDSDGTTQVGTYVQDGIDNYTFERDRYLVGSVNIKRMVKITQADYDDLVLNDSVEPDTLYLIIAPQV